MFTGLFVVCGTTFNVYNISRSSFNLKLVNLLKKSFKLKETIKINFGRYSV